MRVGLIDMSAVFRKHYHADERGALVKTVADVHKYAGECGGRAVVCCDHPPYRRSEKFPAYKSHREKQPAVMYEVQAEACERLRQDGFRVVSAEGFEADDVIATFVGALAGDHEIHIYSSDKDLMQLASESVTVISTATGAKYNPEAIVEKFGVEPRQIPDWLALVGDKSDGLPGLAGCGPKTAATWLQRYGDLEGIFTAVGELEPERFRKPLLDLSKEIQLYRELATLEIIAGIETSISAEAPTMSNSSEAIGEIDAPQARTLSERLCRVMLGVKRLKKNGTNTFHNYKFATDGDVSDLIRELLAFNGVEFGVNMVGVERRKIPGKSGERTVTECTFEMTFRSGDEVRNYYWRGEAQDNEDKGINKAATAAVKYFLLKTFLISTGVPEDDADHAPQQRQQQRGPQRGAA